MALSHRRWRGVGQSHQLGAARHGTVCVPDRRRAPTPAGSASPCPDERARSIAHSGANRSVWRRGRCAGHDRRTGVSPAEAGRGARVRPTGGRGRSATWRPDRASTSASPTRSPSSVSSPKPVLPPPERGLLRAAAGSATRAGRVGGQADGAEERPWMQRVNACFIRPTRVILGSESSNSGRCVPTPYACSSLLGVGTRPASGP